MPDLSSALANANKPAPNPPAAPDPGLSKTFIPISDFITSAKCIRDESNLFIISVVAPF